MLFSSVEQKPKISFKCVIFLCKQRVVQPLASLKIFFSLNHRRADELKHIIGSDTTRRGMLCVFEMFQHAALNRRLTYVLLEGFLATLFPSNRFSELFRRMHAESPTISTTSLSSTSSRDVISIGARRIEVR